MPALTLMNVLAAFVLMLMASLGWYTGSWIVNKLLK